ncbi:MAG: hypothetical protein A3E36_03360 [Candidatus Andersenbacteria bacterium RIFCSPHIGHO2_12_FULL_45_11b]|uniref:Uncharacterized protein n=1 Tax=Candidatus Andersenbacteria bacterium RIFCSPHIGHO2_12_FULL_45_11b TaxID=1797282 RepID=A0A1G1X9F4_9BACT|nr:MAG: hypothetical protein A3E36_03360 [Candidatus Andersenbacteria bacterium RIFCSPHIGHO2_12_FULL_45_11b]
MLVVYMKKPRADCAGFDSLLYGLDAAESVELRTVHTHNSMQCSMLEFVVKIVNHCKCRQFKSQTLFVPRFIRKFNLYDCQVFV